MSIEVKDRYFLLHWVFCSCILGSEHLAVRKQVTECYSSSSDNEIEHKPSLAFKVMFTLTKGSFYCSVMFKICMIVMIKQYVFLKKMEIFY